MFDPRPDGAERVYVFHGAHSTQVLGPRHLTERVRSLLSAAGAAPGATPPAHHDIASRPFTAESLQDPGQEDPSSWSRQRGTVSEVSAPLGPDEFWERVDAGSWATWREQWPESPEAPLFPPSAPDWLARAPRWELDPLAPALGPAASGGWVRSPSQTWGDAVPPRTAGTPPASTRAEHHGVGLFQLTDSESFWVFAAEADTADVIARCERLAEEQPAFTWLTGYFDARDVAGSLRLPAECLPALEEALTVAGYAVDTWW